MTRLWFLLPILLAPKASLPSSEPRAAFAQERIRPEHMRADLTFLASEPLQGRSSLERGSDVAMHWLAAEFSKAGLKPVAGDSFLQPVPLLEYLPDVQKMSLSLHRAGKTSRYAWFQDFTAFFPENTRVSAPVVFAGYGITAPEFHYDDYAKLDVTGKIVIIFDHEPQENDPRSRFNGLGNTRHASTRLKILNAQRHGAVAVLIAPEPNRKHPTTLERFARFPGARERFSKLPAQALVDSELRIPAVTLNESAAIELFATAPRKPAELQASIDSTLKAQSMALRDTVVELNVVNVDAMTRTGASANVVGLLEGSDPQLRGETIVFTSHYDHDGARDGKIFPGADDNASGTVGMVELARAFAASPQRPKRSLLFIAFAAEERGLLGSYHYVKHPLRPLETTRAVLNFDMIGRNETPSVQTQGLVEIAADTSRELNLVGTNTSPRYRTAVEAANRMVGLGLSYKWDNDAALNIFQRSDHYPFELHDIPSVWWFTGFHPDYHQPTDTVEKINFEKMAAILRLAFLTAWTFSDGTPPEYVPTGMP